VIFVDFVQTLEWLMKERGISSFSELEKLSGVSNGTISKWSKGAYRPTIKSLERLAKYLDVSVDWLLTGEEQTSRSTLNGDVNGSAFVQGVNRGSVTVHNGAEHTISAEAAELLRIYEGLDFRGRLELLNKAVALKDAMQPKNGEG
jgi:transcriptional regulator with XRE-family HTH domain